MFFGMSRSSREEMLVNRHLFGEVAETTMREKKKREASFLMSVLSAFRL